MSGWNDKDPDNTVWVSAPTYSPTENVSSPSGAENVWTPTSPSDPIEIAPAPAGTQTMWVTTPSFDPSETVSLPAEVQNVWASKLLLGTEEQPFSVTFGAGLNIDGNNISVRFGTVAGTVARGDDSRIVSALQPSGNLAGLSNPAIARANLGIGNLYANDTVATGDINDLAVTNAKLAQMAANALKGNNAGAPGVVMDLTVAQVRVLLGLGAAALLAVGTTTGTVAAGDDSRFLPVGTVIHVAQNVAPAGFLKANGALVSRTTYASLFTVIGTTYGAGDGSTTFKLPDLRGEFIRGWDDARGIDTGRSIGSFQAQDFLSHVHGTTDPGHNHAHSDPGHAHSIYDPGHVHNSGVKQSSDEAAGYGLANGGGFMNRVRVDGAYNTSLNYTGISVYSNTTGITNVAATTGITINAAGGTETRPRNVALLVCIKY